MTDYYKTALETLYKILKEANEDFWANWIQEDIHLWQTQKSVEHHLHAYGGAGSFNDIPMGTNDLEGIWKSKIFGTVQTLSYSLAKGDSLETILNGIQSNNSKEISGWRCRNCGAASINFRDIELYISSFFIPKIFVDFVKNDKLIDIIETKNILISEEIIQKRQAIESLVKNSTITLASNNNWLWACPKCASTEVCAYRWLVLDNDRKLMEADDNLEIKH